MDRFDGAIRILKWTKWREFHICKTVPPVISFPVVQNDFANKYFWIVVSGDFYDLRNRSNEINSDPCPTVFSKPMRRGNRDSNFSSSVFPLRHVQSCTTDQRTCFRYWHHEEHSFDFRSSSLFPIVTTCPSFSSEQSWSYIRSTSPTLQMVLLYKRIIPIDSVFSQGRRWNTSKFSAFD